MKRAEHIEKSWKNNVNFKLFLQKNKKNLQKIMKQILSKQISCHSVQKISSALAAAKRPSVASGPVASWTQLSNYWSQNGRRKVMASCGCQVHKNIWIQYQYYNIYIFIYKLSLESRCFQNFTPGLRISECESLMRNSTETLKHWFCWCWNYLSWTQTHNQPQRKSAKSKWT